jgi:tetratricopeptide (TPR) repeat protein
LPDQTPEYHARICKLIKKAASGLRDQIAEDPEDASAYNQFAWLVGNTEGDFDEALTYSKKSVEIEPQTGGYYDTLARVYFAKGDYENAVKYQTLAIELDPHSGQMERQLELFKKTLEEQKKKS